MERRLTRHQPSLLRKERRARGDGKELRTSLLSQSHIRLAIWVRVRVTGDAHITRVLGMEVPISLLHPSLTISAGYAG